MVALVVGVALVTATACSEGGGPSAGRSAAAATDPSAASSSTSTTSPTTEKKTTTTTRRTTEATTTTTTTTPPTTEVTTTTTTPPTTEATTSTSTSTTVAAPPSTPPPTQPPVLAGVQAQQQKLNELFYGLGLPGLTVDGDSGRLTEQQLCAARVAMGMPISRADMEPGGPEEQTLMAATSIGIPPTAPTWAGRWVLIDKTCQVMFVGEGADRLVFVFQTSTGSSGYETRDQDGSAVFRYDPARGNNGWHNSYDYPVGADNPLNGNMYKPLYFDNGQAIHGANNVPTNPRSKGCARLHVPQQDALISWLGLQEVGQQIYDAGPIGLIVNAQGDY